MSYIARLASRSAGPASAVAATGGGTGTPVVPTLRSDSPIAAFDQRFNLPGFGALTADAPVGALDGGDDIPIEEDAGTFDLEVGAPSLSTSATPMGIPSVTVASSPRSAAESASERSVTHHVIRERSIVERGSSVSPGHTSVALEQPRVSVGDAKSALVPTFATPESPRVASAPVPATVVPPVPVGAPLVAPEASSSDLEQAPLAVSSLPSNATALAPTPRGTRTTITTAPAGTAAPADFASALQGALSRVEAWMRREPRAPANESGFASPASPGHAENASAFGPIPISDAPPRLNIGRIDVEVVGPPMTPPPARSAVQVVAVAAAAPRPDNLGRFGFGARQR
ncbi:MAG TPA: hypothetical protein VF103_18285 [Polyangiaceae bacterium]